MKTEIRTSLFYDPATGITTRREFECAVPEFVDYNFNELDEIDDTDRRALNRNNGAGICPNDFNNFAPLASLN